MVINDKAPCLFVERMKVACIKYHTYIALLLKNIPRNLNSFFLSWEIQSGCIKIESYVQTAS